MRFRSSLVSLGRCSGGASASVVPEGAGSFAGASGAAGSELGEANRGTPSAVLVSGFGTGGVGAEG